VGDSRRLGPRTCALVVESLTSIDEFERYVDWLAIQADRIEEMLTGDDTF
jgi:hypothetical protein